MRNASAPLAARDHHGAEAINDTLYVFGGRVNDLNSSEAVLNDLWSFSMDAQFWERKSPVGDLPAKRFAMGVSASKVHEHSTVAVFGGERLPGSTLRSTFNDVWTFNVSS